MVRSSRRGPGEGILEDALLFGISIKRAERLKDFEGKMIPLLVKRVSLVSLRRKPRRIQLHGFLKEVP